MPGGLSSHCMCSCLTSFGCPKDGSRCDPMKIYGVRFRIVISIVAACVSLGFVHVGNAAFVVSLPDKMAIPAL